MPTLLIIGQYRFFFFSNEGNEPAHVHVECGNGLAKFWLHNAELAKSRGLRGHELSTIRRLVIEHKTSFLEAWNEYHTRTN